MMKTPKETSVLIAFQKAAAIWDIKMEEVPQLAVQDLKTTCSEKEEEKKTQNIPTQSTLQQSNIVCHVPHERHTSDVCHLKPWYWTKPCVKAPWYDKTSR